MPDQERLSFHPPSPTKRVLAEFRLRQVNPRDICDNIDLLFRQFPYLGGDPEIGHGNYGHCQSWQGDWQWWKTFLQARQSLNKL